MTAVLAACALVDDLVGSGSFTNLQVSACDYGILTTRANACAVTVRPALSGFEILGYGSVTKDVWGFQVDGWVQDSGDVVKTLANVIIMHDALKGAIVGGTVTNCASRQSRITSMQHVPDQAWNFGGPDYFKVTANVQVEEDP